MLSIAPIAGGGAGYYTAQDNYYFWAVCSPGG